MKAVLLVCLCADACTKRNSEAEESNFMINVLYLPATANICMQLLNEGNYVKKENVSRIMIRKEKDI